MRIQFQIALFLVYFILYSFLYLNKHFLYIPEWKLLQFYFGDFFAPIFTLVLYRITISLVLSRKLVLCRFSLRMTWFLIFVLILVFEGYLPNKKEFNQTQDFIDVIMYIMGGYAAYYLFNGKNTSD